MSDKKQKQLGMNPSTASGRLVKDTLWRFIVQANQDSCYQCNGKMTRDNFSIEHKVPWLDSEDPVHLFFDQDNISFSHHSCNLKAARRPTKKYNSPEERNRAKRKYDPLRVYCHIKRKEQYERHGR
jgi:hypothetical protein